MPIVTTCPRHGLEELTVSANSGSFYWKTRDVPLSRLSLQTEPLKEESFGNCAPGHRQPSTEVVWFGAFSKISSAQNPIKSCVKSFAKCEVIEFRDCHMVKRLENATTQICHSQKSGGSVVKETLDE